MQERIQILTRHEKTLNEIQALLLQLEQKQNEWQQLQPRFSEMMAYYGSDQWWADVAAEQQGQLKDVACGVLSEDAIYNVYSQQRTLALDLMKTAIKYLES